MCPRSPDQGHGQCPDHAQNPVPSEVARAMVGGQGGPKTPASLWPPQPAMEGCTPLTCARLAEPSQLLAALAVPPDTCGAGDTGAGRSGYRLRSCPRPARHGAGGIAGPHGRGCHGIGMMLPGAPAGAAVEWAHPVPWSHQSITGPSLLHPRCWLSPSPPSACQLCRHVASSWDRSLPAQAATPQRGWMLGGMPPPVVCPLSCVWGMVQGTRCMGPYLSAQRLALHMPQVVLGPHVDVSGVGGSGGCRCRVAGGWRGWPGGGGWGWWWGEGRGWWRRGTLACGAPAPWPHLGVQHVHVRLHVRQRRLRHPCAGHGVRGGWTRTPRPAPPGPALTGGRGPWGAAPLLPGAGLAGVAGVVVGEGAGRGAHLEARLGH